MLTPAVPISLAIPAFSRVLELRELLLSIDAQNSLPVEIIICEDCSPTRAEIRQLVVPFIDRFRTRGCTLRYLENPMNLGYDGNIRQLLRASSQEWTMLIGNDDLVLPGCFDVALKFLQNHRGVNVVSRAFVRFRTDIHSPLGTSRLAPNDRIFIAGVDKPRLLFRACGFVGGLLVKSSWAGKIDTDQYDGTLFYQIFLAAHAFCQGGIGYISTPIVGGRAGNPPLFGHAGSEKAVHLPGGYTPQGRAKMWKSVLEICRDVGKMNGMNLIDDVRWELSGRQSFHVFEMMVNSDQNALNALRAELQKLELYSHPIPVSLYWLIRIFGRHTRYFFEGVRKIAQ